MSIKKIEWNCPNIAVPAVFNEAMGYTYQLAAFVETLNQMVDSVNSTSDEIANIRTELTTFEKTINDKISVFENTVNKTISGFITSETKARTDFEAEITTAFETFKTEANAAIASGLASAKAALQAQYNDFLSKYQKQFGIAQTTGTSTTDAMSQAAVTRELQNLDGVYFGIKDVIKSISGAYANLNSLEFGIWIYDASAHPNNAPSGVSAKAIVLHYADPDESTNLKAQTYIDIINGTTFTRGYNGTGWSAWSSMTT